MGTQLYNTVEIKGSIKDMSNLLKKVINQNNNKFEIKCDVWQAEYAGCHSFYDDDECNYEIKYRSDLIILKAEFYTKNVPPYYWAEKVSEQFPEIKLAMMSTAFRYPNFLIRYSKEKGLEYLKNYRLLITWLDCIEVETDSNDQFCFVSSGKPVDKNLIPKLIRIGEMKYIKEKLTYLDRLYVWLIKGFVVKIKKTIFNIKFNGPLKKWYRKDLIKALSASLENK